MTHKWFTCCLTLALVCGLLPGYVHAQTALVVGTATDETDGALPGVTVTATDLASGRTIVAISDDRGEYRLVNLPPGKYSIEAELSGFGSVKVPEVELLVGQNATLPLKLKVASLQEDVTVTGDAPLVDTQSAQIAGNVDRRQMEELPVSGRNWMELSMLVKGITSNDVRLDRPGVGRDDQFQLNLDGQQITNKVAGTNSFGQPGLSREAIAEYQIITNLFDITQGRSVGVQVQAISRAGTNINTGSLYGYFRSDQFNAGDFVAKNADGSRQVLPFSNQQIGASFGGPIIRNKLQYFVTYEFERQPTTLFIQPTGYLATISIPTLRRHHRSLGRVDYQLAADNHLSGRFTHYIDDDPAAGVLGNEHPGRLSHLGKDNYALNVNLSTVFNPTTVGELKVGYFYYHWNHTPAEAVPLTPNYSFPVVAIGGRTNYPEEFWQKMPSFRYDATSHKGSHDFKFGGEFLKDRHTGWWQNFGRGIMAFNSTPADLERRFPLDAWNDASRWDLTGLDSIARDYVQFFAQEGGQVAGKCPNPDGCGNWSLDIPRPAGGFWFGDTWKATSALTLNLGVRWDVDWGASAPPLVQETDILIDNGLFSENVGYRNDIRDLNNWSPRVGVNYDVSGNGSFVVRGGAGLYYSVPVSNATFDQQLWNGQRVITNTWVNDRLPGFVQDPRRGVTTDDIVSGDAKVFPQELYVFAHDYQLPQTFQAVVGTQKSLSDSLSVDADVTWSKSKYLGSIMDPNLFYDPATGYNKNPNTFGRPRPEYGRIRQYSSDGYAEDLLLATSMTRRFKDRWQATATYTVMFFRDDSAPGNGGYSGTPENYFDLDLSDTYGRGADFQRHTFRVNSIYQAKWGITLSGAYFFGSGNYYQEVTGNLPFGVPTIGPRYQAGGTLIPRNGLKQDALHKVDLRATKEFRLVGNVKIQGIAEVFNVLNHANFGTYQGNRRATNFRQPVQNAATAYTPRSGQFAFKLSF
ncbi:MAG: hypothetical protein GEU82_06435 [Luteitalea sp.]|nr:hypothetical protein [Luteitalea sp.]